MSRPDMQRREVYYSGRVQGVGFRYTARALAKGFHVAGYVRNLPDGRVELVVEGAPEEVERFLATIDKQMGRYIRDVQQSTSPASGHFKGFEIRF